MAIFFTGCFREFISAVANFNDNTVSVYAVDQTTGAFTPVSGSPFATGVGPASVKFSPIAAGHLYAAIPNTSDSTVSVYSVNQTTGAFTPVTGSPFATGTVPNFAKFSHVISGNLFASVANFNDNTVSVYFVSKTTGVFTEVSGSPFATGSNPYSVQFSPNLSGNLFAAVPNNTGNTISVFDVNTTTGAFTEVAGSPYAAGSGPNELAFSPHVSGHLFAAAVNFSSNNISVYDVDTTTGEFTEVTGSPFASGGGPDGIAFSLTSTGTLFAATGNFFDNNASVYQVTINSTTPKVNSVLPHHGPIAGGTTVTITGKNFTGATAVNFGILPAASFTVVNDTSIAAVSPPGVGTVDVTVTSPFGTSAISAGDKFNYR